MCKRKASARFAALCLAAAFLLSSAAFASDAGGMDQMPPDGMGDGEMGAPPDGMGGSEMGAPPDGGGGGGDAAPTEGAIVFSGGEEDTASEYEPGAWSGSIRREGETNIVSDFELTSGDYTFNGICAIDTIVRLENAKIHLSVDSPASDDDTGGAAVNLDDGAAVYISDSELTVDGAARYVTAAYNDAMLVVNNSSVTSTGSNENTAEVSDPFSNEALLISGTARANFSIGATRTYYFNSSCTAEGWAALSTDSATGNGLDLYAYNTDATARNGGYATYADTNCRVWLYGSRLHAGEIGCIISKSGQIHTASASAVPDEVDAYNEGERVDCESEILGGRNAVMIHAPDMMGQGLAAADCGSFEQTGGLLGTSTEYASTKDYSDYSDAVGAYIDYVSGDVILVRSTSANIDLTNVSMESYNGVLVHTVLNADSMGNFLAAGDGDQVNPIAVSMTDMEVTGDILHEDYQRNMTVTLSGSTLSGNIISGSMDSWNSRWADYGEVNWVVDDSFDAVYGVALTLENGAVWNVTGESSLTSLTVSEDSVINGEITLDGAPLTPEAGVSYSGEILVSGSYVPEEEAAPEAEPAEDSEEEASVIENDETEMLEAAEASEAVEETPAAETGEAAEATSATGETDEESQSEESSNGIGGGAVAGIAVVVLAAAAGAYALIRKKKKS